MVSVVHIHFDELFAIIFIRLNGYIITNDKLSEEYLYIIHNQVHTRLQLSIS